ncbi:MAG TPA: hypothetical protein VHB98_10075 [Chloroflexota bacterium]|nr:hypothetical protein [Chloroflexota bacterium]
MALLDGLDDIDWHSLSHAYGPADDGVRPLWNLASSDATVRGDTRHQFYGNIWHHDYQRAA